MSVKTARKYLHRVNKLPSDLQTVRKYRTRKDPFVKHWDEIESMLESAPELQATTILAYLTEKYYGNNNGKQLRCLQKRLKQWRSEDGHDKPVIFLQNILLGKQSQSDWTNINQLGILLVGETIFSLIISFYMFLYS